MSIVSHSCTIPLLVAILLSYSAIADKATISLGLAALNEGDDRYRGGFAISSEYQRWGGSLAIFLRDFGPVRDETYLLGTLRNFALSKKYKVDGRFGLGVQYRILTLKYPQLEHKALNRRKGRFNAGPLVGMRWRFAGRSGLAFELSWDSVFYPAGLTGGILLATGVHHVVGAALGVRF